MSKKEFNYLKRNNAQFRSLFVHQNSIPYNPRSTIDRYIYIGEVKPIEYKEDSIVLYTYASGNSIGKAPIEILGERLEIQRKHIKKVQNVFIDEAANRR